MIFFKAYIDRFFNTVEFSMLNSVDVWIFQGSNVNFKFSLSDLNLKPEIWSFKSKIYELIYDYWFILGKIVETVQLLHITI